MKVLSLLLLAGIGFAQAPATDPFEDISFDLVESIVRLKQPATLPDLLRELPKKFMASYTLVHQSFSSQDASKAYPRAIVFGKTARFIMAFNGDPSQEGYSRLEMMQYREQTGHYELREVSFGATGAAVSNANPPRCLACHGEVPHPIWQTYPSWPGVYGSSDDFVGSGDEFTPFMKFVQSSPEHPRYRFLQRIPEISDRWPYRASQVPDGDFGEQHVYRPNDRLGRLLGGLASRSAEALALHSPFFHSHEHAVLFHFLRCDAPPAFLPAIDKLFGERFPPADFPELYHDLATVKDPHYQATVKLEKLITDSDAGSWNLALGFLPNGDRFSPDGFGYDDPAFYVKYGNSDIDDLLATRLLERMSSHEPALKRFFQPLNAVQNYVHLNDASRSINLTNWGVDKLYDSVNRFMDYSVARQACPVLQAAALGELKI